MRSNVVRSAPTDNSGHSLPQHAVEFVDEQIDRSVGVFRRHRRGQIRSGNLNSSFGYEDACPIAEVTFNVDAHSKNIRLVAE